LPSIRPGVPQIAAEAKLLQPIERLLGLFASKLGLRARERDREIDWLGYVVVSAEFQRLDDVGTTRFRGDHDHRQDIGRMAGPNLPEHLDAVWSRHHDIEQNEIEFLLSNEIECRRTGFGLYNHTSAPGKPPAEHGAIICDIIDDQ